MRTVVTLDITDEQRSQLACLLAGKAVKRLATREEIRDYVLGSIARLSEVKSELEQGAVLVQPARAPASASNHLTAFNPKEAEQIVALRAAGKSDSYIAGWLKPGRFSKFSRPAAQSAVAEISIDSGDPSP